MEKGVLSYLAHSAGSNGIRRSLPTGRLPHELGRASAAWLTGRF